VLWLCEHGSIKLWHRRIPGVGIRKVFLLHRVRGEVEVSFDNFRVAGLCENSAVEGDFDHAEIRVG
jgi:hypothetical protein